MFHHFRSCERKQVKLLLQSHQGVTEVKTTLIQFLTEWNDKEWVDWEEIELVMRDLHRIKFWRMLPYNKFLNEAGAEVSPENMVILRKLPY